MATPVKFLFDTEFGAEAKRAPEPKLALAEHEELLALARLEGERQGREEGERLALASVARERALALGVIGDRLAAAAEALAGMEGRVEHEAIDIAVAVAAKLSGALVHRHPMEEIRHLVGDCLANLRAVPHLVVRVNDDLMEEARTELTRLAADRGFEGRLVILAEPVIPRGDCRIEWSTGGVMLDRQEIADRIAEAVDRFVATRSAAGAEEPQ